MPLLKIQSYPGNRQVFIAGEGIADLATVELVHGERQVRMGSTDNRCLAAGVARGQAVSGALVYVIVHGVLSGVKTANDAKVDAADTLAIATSGRVAPFNFIAPLINLISGAMFSGAVGVDGQALVITSGPISGVTGIQTIATARVVGRALTSGGSGAAIQMLVSLQ